MQAGFNPADFDIKKAVFDPRGRAVFLPVRATDEVRRQAQAFVQNEQSFLLVDLLYARQPFEFQGKRYGRGVHSVVLENVSAANAEGRRPEHGPRMFNEGPGYDGGSCNNNSGYCSHVVFSGPTGSGSYGPIVIQLPPPPQPGPNPGLGACAALSSLTRFIRDPRAALAAGAILVVGCLIFG